jgi:hypothetical protein
MTELILQFSRHSNRLFARIKSIISRHVWPCAAAPRRAKTKSSTPSLRAFTGNVLARGAIVQGSDFDSAAGIYAHHRPNL